jgi:hypothetical protein
MGAKYPNLEVVTGAFDGSIAVDIDDLIYLDVDDLKPASSQSDQGTETKNQALFARNFAGVAKERKLVTETDSGQTLDVVPVWLGEMTCASDTYEVGDLVTVDEAAGGTTLEDQKLVKTCDKALAIGYCTKREASAATTVNVCLMAGALPPHVREDEHVHQVSWFDDFLDDTLDDFWAVASGTDAQATNPAISAAADGTIICVSGDDDGTVAADGSSITGEVLQWKAADGGLEFECRVKLNIITKCVVNLGFTDVACDTTLEIPINVDGSDEGSATATNAVVFGFDTGSASDHWMALGVKADTEVEADTGLAPTAGTWQRFKIVVDASGNAKFYIDGNLVASLDDAVTATTLLTPIVVLSTEDGTASITLTCDYIGVRKSRG